MKRGGLVPVMVASMILSVSAYSAPVGALAASVSPVAARGGEQWYGQLSTQASHTVVTNDGGIYVNRDTYSLTAPTTGDNATLNMNVSVVLTHGDPDPTVDGCYTRRETWTGTGQVPATFRVQSNVGGQNYIIDVESLSPITVFTTVKFGGFSGGADCSLGDYDGDMSYSPWISIHSGKNARPTFRGGSNTKAARPNNEVCDVVSECTDYPALGGTFPRLHSQWSIAARECTGYSRSYGLGKQDTLFVFNPCQTKSLSSRVNFLQEIDGQPKICDYAYVKRLAKACNGYKAVTRIEWGQAIWFLSGAARSDACGIWVVDRASYRSPKVRAARNPSGDEIVWINVGESQRVKSATGAVTVTCP